MSRLIAVLNERCELETAGDGGRERKRETVERECAISARESATPGIMA